MKKTEDEFEVFIITQALKINVDTDEVDNIRTYRDNKFAKKHFIYEGVKQVTEYTGPYITIDVHPKHYDCDVEAYKDSPYYLSWISTGAYGSPNFRVKYRYPESMIGNATTKD